MIGRRELPAAYREWNRRWGAPLPPSRPDAFELLADPAVAREELTPFSLQPNTTTRSFEYPWAYETIDPRPGMRVVEIGGALSGFQITLSAAGAQVVNVDPFYDYGATTSYAGLDPETALGQMNAAWGTDVELVRTTIDRAGLEPGSVDVVVSLSVIEHLPREHREAVVAEAARVLRPGGRLVLTVDLFFDLVPFTDRETNRWGSNVDIAQLVDHPDLELVLGTTSELYGFADFEPRVVQAQMSEYFIGLYPGVVQALVLRRR